MSEVNLQLVLMLAHAQRRGHLDDYLTRQHVDGVLLVSLHDDDRLPQRIRARGLPGGARRPDHRVRGGGVRRRGQRARRPARGRPPGAPRPAAHRDHRRPGRHGGRPRPATRATSRGWPPAAASSTSGWSCTATSGRTSGEAGMRNLLVRRARGGRRLLRQRPDGGRGAAGAARGRPAGAGRRVGRRLRRRAARAVDAPAADDRAPVAGADGPGDGLAAGRRDGPPRRAARSRGSCRPTWWSATAAERRRV